MEVLRIINLTDAFFSELYSYTLRYTSLQLLYRHPNYHKLPARTLFFPQPSNFPRLPSRNPLPPLDPPASLHPLPQGLHLPTPPPERLPVLPHPRGHGLHGHLEVLDVLERVVQARISGATHESPVQMVEPELGVAIAEGESEDGASHVHRVSELEDDVVEAHAALVEAVAQDPAVEHAAAVSRQDHLAVDVTDEARFDEILTEK